MRYKQHLNKKLSLNCKTQKVLSNTKSWRLAIGVNVHAKCRLYLKSVYSSLLGYLNIFLISYKAFIRACYPYLNFLYLSCPLENLCFFLPLYCSLCLFLLCQGGYVFASFSLSFCLFLFLFKIIAQKVLHGFG